MRIKVVMMAVAVLLAFSEFSSAGDIDASLNKAKAEGKIVMLELGSVGCISCEQMKPVMARLSDAYKGKMEVIFVDVREDRTTARKFGVFVIPVQVFLNKKGKEFHRHIGFYSYEEIVPMLKKRAGI
jgi:thioredoxin 1